MIVLGTAQDGGVPQIGCGCENCRRARAAAGHTRLAASLAAVCGPGDVPHAVLVDAGPDLRRQWDRWLAPGTALGAALVTHLHMGHIAGLLELGPEVMAASAAPVYCSRAVARFLRSNGPWSLLVRRGHIDLREFLPGETVHPAPGLTAQTFEVPHRNEFGDTVGFRLSSEETGLSLLYIPDADRWEGIRPGLVELVRASDAALLDGTFFDRSELLDRRGRDASEVPHPPIRDTLDLLGPLAAKVFFTHLNHTNPVLDGSSPQARAVLATGARIAADGMRIQLGPVPA
ncbi:MAG: hypothetical protein A2Y96_02850 [Firmicutes bacterium RBG_13_65_8]|nr:MAG: hypothetical protein A2Y96_02850 [Firmicutes bacterium RBG_13_65_8]